MKNFIKKTGILLTLLVFAWSCQEDDITFGNIKTPTGLTVDYEIVGVDSENPNGDGSGLVNFTANAEHAISYKYIFSDGSSYSSPTGAQTKRFSKNGVNTYQVTVLANGTGGVSSSTTFDITVFSSFSDDEAIQFLTDGSSKTWYWSASEAGHLGVGPNSTNPDENAAPIWYAAGPFEKAASPDSSCLYEDQLKFTLDGDILKYELNNGGKTFFNVAYNSVGGGSDTVDMCYAYDTSGEKTVTLGPSDSVVAQTNPDATRGTVMEFSNGGFMGYYIGSNTYEILSISENRMVVRSVAGNDAGLAWYHIFTTTPVDEQGQGGAEEPEYNTLVWSEEFDVDGAPDPAKWTMEIGTGVSGWGNNEAQYYRAENAVVEGGILKITAKAESFSGSSYTSARMITKDKYEFTYGKVEVRAKLPTGGGTWPAIWMLGANFDDVGWPACGEIDIMEHVGNDQNTIHGTLHYPGHSGGNAVSQSTTVETASTEFHIYSVVWNPLKIRFYVDGIEYHTFNNDPSIPYHHDFFLILNVAMGGNFGGAIDPAFTQSTMEVDYIKVYQE